MSTTTAKQTVPLTDRTLADIATTLPGATRIFREHKLDFCCGGTITLAEATNARGLDAAVIADRLAALAPSEVAAPSETAALIDYLLDRYHAAHRREWPELLRLGHRVEEIHRGHPALPVGLAALLDEFGQEMESHMRKEEAILFPLMRAGGHPALAEPIAVMEAEHDEHGRALARIEEITGGLTPPADACPTWRALYAGIEKLSGELMEHVHLENHVLFPRFAA